MTAFQRPSVAELNCKIQTAIAIVAGGAKFFFANDLASMAEIRSEDFNIDEIESIVLECLQEIMANDYAGGRPPYKSYEDKIKNSDLFAFAWHSKSRKKRMYLKFVIKNGCFFYVSFHEDRKG